MRDVQAAQARAELCDFRTTRFAGSYYHHGGNVTEFVSHCNEKISGCNGGRSLPTDDEGASLLTALLERHQRPVDASRALGLKDGTVGLWVHRGGVPYPKRRRVSAYLGRTARVSPMQGVVTLPAPEGLMDRSSFQEVWQMIGEIHRAYNSEDIWPLLVQQIALIHRLITRGKTVQVPPLRARKPRDQ